MTKSDATTAAMVLAVVGVLAILGFAILRVEGSNRRKEASAFDFDEGETANSLDVTAQPSAHFIPLPPEGLGGKDNLWQKMASLKREDGSSFPSGKDSVTPIGKRQTSGSLSGDPSSPPAGASKEASPKAMSVVRSRSPTNRAAPKVAFSAKALGSPKSSSETQHLAVDSAGSAPRGDAKSGRQVKWGDMRSPVPDQRRTLPVQPGSNVMYEESSMSTQSSIMAADLTHVSTMGGGRQNPEALFKGANPELMKFFLRAHRRSTMHAAMAARRRSSRLGLSDDDLEALGNMSANVSSQTMGGTTESEEEEEELASNLNTIDEEADMERYTSVALSVMAQRQVDPDDGDDRTK